MKTVILRKKSRVLNRVSGKFNKAAAQVIYSRINRFMSESRGEMSTGFIIGAIITVVIGVILFTIFKDTLIPQLLNILQGKINEVN